MIVKFVLAEEQKKRVWELYKLYLAPSVSLLTLFAAESLALDQRTICLRSSWFLLCTYLRTPVVKLWANIDTRFDCLLQTRTYI